MSADDKMFNVAVDYLENSGQLPPKVTNKFLATCLRQVHGEAVCAKKKATDNEKRMIRIETWQAWLKIAGVGGMGAAVVSIIELLRSVL